MDIDVKNAYCKMIRSCRNQIQDLIIEDIYQFIKYISVDGAEDRFESFCKIYVQEEVSVNPIQGNMDLFESKAIEYLDGFDRNAIASIIAFFTVLGKYYIFSKFDKKEINKDKYVSAITAMKANAENKTVEQVQNTTAVQVTAGKINAENKVTQEKKETDLGEEILVEPEESLAELLDKLNSLIGLDSVKEEVNQMINLIRLQKKGEELGEKSVPLSLHLVFYGNPGTGKTTVARLIAKIYKALGVLSKGQLVETDRGGLVGGYVGQTAIKTQEVIDKAMGGVLFIDEAYTLTRSKSESDFGQEAVDTILKAMEDHRDDFIVIAAGYPDLMKEFISSNPGLKSRFNQYINFEDYTPEQLKKIFLLDCKMQNLVLGEGCGEFLLKYFADVYQNRSDTYANGRDVRNYFEKVIKMRANRLSPILDKITVDEYRIITMEDLETAKQVKSSNWQTD